MYRITMLSNIYEFTKMRGLINDYYGIQNTKYKIQDIKYKL